MQLLSWLGQRMGRELRSRLCQKHRPAQRFRPRLEALDDRWLPSTLTVLNVNDSGLDSFRAEIAAAQSGDTIVFDPSLAGQTINLTSGELVIDKSLDIEGPGGKNAVSISGNSASRVFDIAASRITVRLAQLVIEDGSASQGAGIFDGGASLTLAGVTLIGNHGLGSSAGDAAQGAAIYAANSTVTLTNCGFLINFVNGAASGSLGAGGDGQGGAIYSVNSTLGVTNCTFQSNGAFGGDFTSDYPFDSSCERPGAAQGGSIYAANSAVMLTNCTLESDSALGGSARFTSGNGQGGGIYSSNSTLALTNCALNGDVSGSGGGGGIYEAGGTFAATNCEFQGDQAFGMLGGGGLYVGGTATVQNCVFDSDQAFVAGAIYVAPSGSVFISHTTFFDNYVEGGVGGGIYNAGTATLSGCTLSGNHADNGGGGIYNTGTMTVSGCTLSGNSASQGGAIYNAGTLKVSNSHFSGNSPDDIFGPYVDGGGNTFN